MRANVHHWAKKGTATTVLLVTAIICLGKALGFVREILLASGFGAAGIVDAFLMSESIATIFLGWLTSFSVIYTPIYQEIRQRDGERIGNEFTGTLLLFIEMLSFAVIILSLICKNFLVGISAPGYSDEQQSLTSTFLRIVLWTQLFNGSCGILSAYLNCNDKKVISSGAVLVSGSLQLVCVFIAKVSNNTNYLALGLLFAAAGQFLFLLLFSKPTNLRFRISGAFRTQIKKVLLLTIPVFISSLISEIEVYVDKLFASFLPAGSVSVLHYAGRIRILFLYIASTIMMAVFYPELSKISVSGDKQRFKEYVSTAVEWVLVFFIPLTVGCIILSKPIIALVFGHGAFSKEALDWTSSAFAFYAVSFMPAAVRDLLIRTLYARKKTKYSMYVGVATVLTNVIANMLLIKAMGHNGLALGTSISVFISVVLYYIFVKKEMGSVIEKRVLFTALKTLISSLIMGVIVFAVYTLLSDSLVNAGSLYQFVIILAIGLLGLVSFGLLCHVMRVEIICNLFKKRKST